MSKMKTYIALLRGINVSGQKKIKMPDLRTCFEEMGCKDVQTYIQSGNVIFNHEAADSKELEQKIEQQILNKFGFQVENLVRTPSDLENIIKNNPFIGEPDKEVNGIYITLLSEVPSFADKDKLKDISYKPEEFFIEERTIYLFLPFGYGRTKLNNNFFESKLKMKATTRNWKTVATLLELCNS